MPFLTEADFDLHSTLTLNTPQYTIGMHHTAITNALQYNLGTLPFITLIKQTPRELIITIIDPNYPTFTAPHQKVIRNRRTSQPKQSTTKQIIILQKFGKPPGFSQ